MDQKNNNKKIFFPDIGDSLFTADFIIGQIPVICIDDSEDIKEKKKKYIKRKLASLRSSLRTP